MEAPQGLIIDGPIPARYPLMLPPIKIQRMATEPGHAIDRGRSPKYPPTGLLNSAMVKVLLGFCLVPPVIFRSGFECRP